MCVILEGMRGYLMNWYKEEPESLIYWKDTGSIGEWVFSFDQRTEYNLFRDYPYKLTDEQRIIFDSEYPHWKEFFRDRTRTESA